MNRDNRIDMIGKKPDIFFVGKKWNIEGSHYFPDYVLAEDMVQFKARFAGVDRFWRNEKGCFDKTK